jgi:hypothetical protein
MPLWKYTFFAAGWLFFAIWSIAGVPERDQTRSSLISSLGTPPSKAPMDELREDVISNLYRDVRRERAQNQR